MDPAKLEGASAAFLLVNQVITVCQGGSFGGHILCLFYGILLVAYLVGGFKHGIFLFSISYTGSLIPPIDEFIFFKMVIAPPSSYSFP